MILQIRLLAVRALRLKQRRIAQLATHFIPLREHSLHKVVWITWDHIHTVLPATRQRSHSRFPPAEADTRLRDPGGMQG